MKLMEKDNNLDAFNKIVNALKGLDVENQRRTIQTVLTYLDISISSQRAGNSVGIDEVRSNSGNNSGVSFSENRSMSPKEFLRDKQPSTDIERVTCLAYYLTHYKELPYFKSLDLSSLNTEAAQPKFSNVSVAVDNATKAGFLVQATKGNKQLSAIGETYVQALPDREVAKANIANEKMRRRKKKMPKISKKK